MPLSCHIDPPSAFSSELRRRMHPAQQPDETGRDIVATGLRTPLPRPQRNIAKQPETRLNGALSVQPWLPPGCHALTRCEICRFHSHKRQRQPVGYGGTSPERLASIQHVISSQQKDRAGNCIQPALPPYTSDPDAGMPLAFSVNSASRATFLLSGRCSSCAT